MYDYNLAAHGPEYAAAEDRRYRAECRVRVLESSLDRIDMRDFDRVMSELMDARAELWAAGQIVLDLRWKAARADMDTKQ
ncbi:MAG: hypothetical protein E7425_10600 [Ruminococcaceae bacterium]|nr:hypothetical protein [Oscillospiraceae bacterium]